jgi:hypothetical protein
MAAGQACGWSWKMHSNMIEGMRNKSASDSSQIGKTHSYSTSNSQAQEKKAPNEKAPPTIPNVVKSTRNRTAALRRKKMGPESELNKSSASKVTFEPTPPPDVYGVNYDMPRVENEGAAMCSTPEASGVDNLEKNPVPLNRTERVLLNAKQVGSSIWDYIHAADLIGEPAKATRDNLTVATSSPAVKCLLACWDLAEKVNSTKVIEHGLHDEIDKVRFAAEDLNVSEGWTYAPAEGFLENDRKYLTEALEKIMQIFDIRAQERGQASQARGQVHPASPRPAGDGQGTRIRNAKKMARRR